MSSIEYVPQGKSGTEKFADPGDPRVTEAVRIKVERLAQLGFCKADLGIVLG